MSQSKTEAVLETANRLHETMQKAQQEMEVKHYHGSAHGIDITLNGRYEIVSLHVSEQLRQQPPPEMSHSIQSAFHQALSNIREAATSQLTELSKQFSNQLSDTSSS